MQSLTLALQIYGMGFMLAFLLAVMIKIMLSTIRFFSGNHKEKAQHAD